MKFLGQLASCIALCSAPFAQNLPAGFEVVPLPGAFDRPVGLTFTDAGELFVIEQRGVVRYHDGQTLQAAFVLDLRDEVNQDHDRGMLGIALHPGFAPDGGATSWVYLLYTVSPVSGQDMDFDEDGKYSFSRLTRYQVDAIGGDLVCDLGSREVLLGNQLPDGSVPDGIASLHNSHSNGSLHFADDGSLLVATGDGAHYNFTDTGGSDPEGFDDFTHPVTGLKGPMPAEQDSGAFRSQDLRSLAGKILRLDPATGGGFASNPFYDGDASSNRSKVWALGVRNPYRVAMFPGTGASDPAAGQPNVLALGDVGDIFWEELNVVQGGENFGWPCYEGFGTKFSFQQFNPPAPEFPNCNTASFGTHADPLVSWHHFFSGSLEPSGFYVDEAGSPLSGFTGATAIGGAIYAGGPYPDHYDGRLFFGDYALGWIKTIEFDANYDLVAIKPFGTAMGQLVAIESHPVTGDLYLAKVFEGEIERIRYVDPDPTTAYGCGVNPGGSLALASAGVTVGETADFAVHNPLGTQSPGALTALGLAAAPDTAFPCGTLLPGFGMTGAGANGELLISLQPGATFPAVPGPPWTGAPTAVPVEVPYQVTLVGTDVYVQGVLVDPTFGGGAGAGIALTEALRATIGS